MGYRMQIYRIRAGILHQIGDFLCKIAKIMKKCLVIKKKALYLYPER